MYPIISQYTPVYPSISQYTPVYHCVGGKVQYIEPDQLSLPDDYSNVKRFPERNVTTDGYVVCVDGSAPLANGTVQCDMFKKIISSIQVNRIMHLW